MVSREWTLCSPAECEVDSCSCSWTSKRGTASLSKPADQATSMRSRRHGTWRQSRPDSSSGPWSKMFGLEEVVHVDFHHQETRLRSRALAHSFVATIVQGLCRGLRCTTQYLGMLERCVSLGGYHLGALKDSLSVDFGGLLSKPACYHGQLSECHLGRKKPSMDRRGTRRSVESSILISRIDISGNYAGMLRREILRLKFIFLLVLVRLLVVMSSCETTDNPNTMPGGTEISRAELRKAFLFIYSVEVGSSWSTEFSRANNSATRIT